MAYLFLYINEANDSIISQVLGLVLVHLMEQFRTCLAKMTHFDLRTVVATARNTSTTHRREATTV